MRLSKARAISLHRLNRTIAVCARTVETLMRNIGARKLRSFADASRGSLSAEEIGTRCELG